MSKPKPYWQQLQDPRWQKKRLEILARQFFTCESCGDTETALDVHHKYYKKGVSAWDYPEDAFCCVCKNCHEKVDGYYRNILTYFTAAGAEDFSNAIEDAMRLGIIENDILNAIWGIVQIKIDALAETKKAKT
jgi:hypothetical protein